MSNLNAIRKELDNTIGFAERNRLTEDARTAAINESLGIIYGILMGSPILKRTTTINVDSSKEAIPPTDFNDGSILYVGDNSIYDNSNEIVEVDRQVFGRLTSDDKDFMTREIDDDGNTIFKFNSVASTECYFEYEIGAPVLVSLTDNDNLPTRAKYAIAKLSAGILTGNLLSDETRMATYLYGPRNDASNYSPDSIMGQVMQWAKTQSVRRQGIRAPRVTVFNRPTWAAPWRRRYAGSFPPFSNGMGFNRFSRSKYSY